jgi:4-hydroxy-tetrahydrodipicolinate synthase
MSLFEGIWIPLVTPFRNGTIDLDAAQRLAVDYADSGVHGLIVCGTTGEAATLSEEEQATLLCAVQEAVAPRCPVVFGIGGSDTRAVAAKVAHFNQYEAAGYLISAPAYVRPSQLGITRHYQEIAQETDIPIVIYNVPCRTGVDIELSTVIALAADSGFAAIKQCGSDVVRIAELVNRTDLKVLCGDDALMFASLCLGGHGAMTASAHIRPDLYVSMFDLIRAGEIAQARVIFNALLPLIKLMFSEPNPAPVKAALALQGRIREELRLPMTPMSTVGKLQIAGALEQVLALPKSLAPGRQARESLKLVSRT